MLKECLRENGVKLCGELDVNAGCGWTENGMGNCFTSSNFSSHSVESFPKNIFRTGRLISKIVYCVSENEFQNVGRK